MRGSNVIVRDFMGKPLVRRLWAIEGNIAYIVRDAEYQRLSAGEEAISPIGFPIEDVFEFDADAAEMAAGGNSFDWKVLTEIRVS